MKIRHAVALSLIGWYLILPPISGSMDKRQVDLEAYLGDWDQHAAFDTAKECETKRVNLRHCGQVLNGDDPNETVEQACGFKARSRTQLLDPKEGEHVALRAQRYISARCIASDDPRLKQE